MKLRMTQMRTTIGRTPMSPTIRISPPPIPAMMISSLNESRRLRPRSSRGAQVYNDLERRGCPLVRGCVRRQIPVQPHRGQLLADVTDVPELNGVVCDSGQMAALGCKAERADGLCIGGPQLQSTIPGFQIEVFQPNVYL